MPNPSFMIGEGIFLMKNIIEEGTTILPVLHQGTGNFDIGERRVWEWDGALGAAGAQVICLDLD